MTFITDKTNGTWVADASHSEIGFVVRHAGISKVRGQFTDFSATVEDSDTETLVKATINAESFNSNSADRDGHIKSADFLDVANFPTLEFVGQVVGKEEAATLVGDLTIHGVTLPATFDIDFGGIAVDPFGATRLGVEAKTVISRKSFGLTWNAALEAGGVLVSDKVSITLDLSFVQQ